MYADDTKQVRVVELLVFRGWDFNGRGQKKLQWSPTPRTISAVQTPWQVTQPKLNPPPPPPLVWQAYMYICTTTQERTPYYYNIMTKVTTWVRPSEPFLPPPEQNVVVQESWKHSNVEEETVDDPEAEQVVTEADEHKEEYIRKDGEGNAKCLLCGKVCTSGHLQTRKHINKAHWWRGASVAKRMEWLAENTDL